MAGVDGPTLVVVVDRSGQIYYRNQIVKDAELKVSLRNDALALKLPATLVIQADKAVPYDIIVQLGKMATEAGLKRALLATRPPLLSAPAPAEPHHE
jgi:biopolymer transport protein ExbD